MTAARPGFGALLRRGRRHLGLTQLELSLRAEVSARHLSWLENDRAAPSRAMVLRLADRLGIPARERNEWLAAAGFAPLFSHRTLDDPALAAALQAVRQLLVAHEPWPALALDGHWNIVAANAAVHALLGLVDPDLREPPVNALRLSLHPRGLARWVEDLPAWRAHALARLERACALHGDAQLLALRDELRAYAPPEPRAGHASAPAVSDPAPQADAQGNAQADPRSAAAVDDVVVCFALRTPLGRLAFVTTITVFGAPRDVSLAELAIETLLPADASTAEALRALAAAAEHRPDPELSPA